MNEGELGRSVRTTGVTSNSPFPRGPITTGTAADHGDRLVVRVEVKEDELPSYVVCRGSVCHNNSPFFSGPVADNNAEILFVSWTIGNENSGHFDDELGNRKVGESQWFRC